MVNFNVLFCFYYCTSIIMIIIWKNEFVTLNFGMNHRLESAESAVLLPSGGDWAHRSCLLPVLAVSVFGIDMRLPLTLFDISLFLLLCIVHSNPPRLLNGENWELIFFFYFADIWQMDSLQTGFCGISSKAISLPFCQSTVNFSYPGLLLVVAEWI